VVKWVLVTLVLVPVVAGVWTVMSWSVSVHGAENPSSKSTWGIAHATSCEQLGPISRGGIGYYWVCRGTVDWVRGSNYNRTTSETFGLDELTPAEIGKPVRVREKSGPSRTDQSAPEVVRETERPYEWVGYVTLVTPFVLYAVFHEVRRRRRERAEPEI
jgi:hypothetical protein